jgi:hypothetical protein
MAAIENKPSAPIEKEKLGQKSPLRGLEENSVFFFTVANALRASPRTKTAAFISGEIQEIAGKKTEETSQTAATRAQGKIPRASLPSQSQTASQALQAERET